MGRKFLIAAVLVPLLCFFWVKYQDGDFILMIYERIGQDPATALRRKVIWITGASSGIGEYLAYELAKYGCKLVLSARRKEKLERVKENCAAIATSLDSSFKKDHNILVLLMDVTKYEAHENLTQAVLKHFGKIDILVNNAGRGQRAWLKSTPLEVDRALLDLNLISTISLTKAVLPHMIKHHEGQIVVVSSILGKFGGMTMATYSASKHALQGYFDSARMELAEHNIHVQTILPGPVESEVQLHSFTNDVNVELKDSAEYFEFDTNYMTTERCAKLMVVGMANNLDEVWITTNPQLLFLYMRQYFPNLHNWFMKAITDGIRAYLKKQSQSESNKRQAQET